MAWRPRAVSFDCYGTLIDWETGLERGMLWILREKRDAPSAERVVKAWERHERDLTSGKGIYRRYREVVAEALHRSFDELGVPWEPSDGHRLAGGMGAWEPFGDVQAALDELRGLGYPLAILSNTDDDILAESVKRIGVDFELLLTAEQVKAYKPDERVFVEGLKRLDLRAADVLHVSFSPYHDLEPAKRLGFRTFWVDRHGLGETEVPHDHASRTLRGLADLLRALA